MAKFQIDGSALAVAILASAFGFSLLPGPFSWLASISGLVLAIVLLAFDREGVRSVFESLGFSAVVGLGLTLASAVIFRAVIANQGQAATFDGRVASEYLPLFWVAVTVFIWIVDRSRMPGRVSYGTTALPQSQPAHFQPQPHSVPPASFSFSPNPPPVVPAPVHPVRHPTPTGPPAPEPPAQPVMPSRPLFTQPSFESSIEDPPHVATPPSSGLEPPVLPTPFVQPSIPPPPPAPVAAPLFAEAPSAPQEMAPPPPPPSAAIAPIPPGKEATVYVTLVGEGLNVLRAVRAEHLGRDYYRIADDMPPGEIWQFGPGQVVRCKKKNLSSGKAMVATEEAPRATQ